MDDLLNSNPTIDYEKFEKLLAETLQSVKDTQQFVTIFKRKLAVSSKEQALQNLQFIEHMLKTEPLNQITLLAGSYYISSMISDGILELNSRKGNRDKLD